MGVGVVVIGGHGIAGGLQRMADPGGAGEKIKHVPAARRDRADGFQDLAEQSPLATDIFDHRTVNIAGFSRIVRLERDALRRNRRER